MGNVSFNDRFELLELLRDDEVQTFRARERSTGRPVEAHFAGSSGLLAKIESAGVMDRGTHEGKLYVVTAAQGLDSAGAWQIPPHDQPREKASPGDFTRMFELRQAPEPVAAPSAKIVQEPAASQPGEFTRVFKKPAVAPAAADSSTVPGGQGEFTRMFRKPQQDQTVACSPAPVPVKPKSRVPVRLIVIVAVILFAIAVLELVRTLY